MLLDSRTAAGDGKDKQKAKAARNNASKGKKPRTETQCQSGVAGHACSSQEAKKRPDRERPDPLYSLTLGGFRRLRALMGSHEARYVSTKSLRSFRATGTFFRVA